MAKPAGVPVIPGRGWSGPCLRDLLTRSRGRVFVVHRIDQGASGVVLFAKDAVSHRRLSLQFERRQVSKTYLVLAQGVVESDGSVDRPVKEFGSGRMGVAAGGKTAVTRWKVLERFREASLLQVEPLTGRRHQIRVHLYSIGHPVAGDPLYGRRQPGGGVEAGAARLMLHALEIGFDGPDGRRATVRCEPPEDFSLILRGLRAGNA